MAERHTLTRRSFLAGSGAGLIVLSGCGGGSSASGGTELTYTTYDLPDNEVIMGQARRWAEGKRGVTVKLQSIPGVGNYWTQLDTRLAGDQGPDIVRIQYQRMGFYSSEGAVIDLSKTFDPFTFGAQITPAHWETVTYRDGVYGLPHHTDTFGLFYNVKYFEKLGIEPPASLAESWTWDEFTAVARRLIDETEAKYGFAMNWQGGSSYRWMPFLYMNGGELVGDDGRTPRIAEPRGIEALEWTRRWFTEHLVPPSTTVKSQEEIQNLFAQGIIGMMLNGDWLLPQVKEVMGDDGWGVTYMPRAQSMASDLGGNAFCVTKDCKEPELAADLLAFLAREENMREFYEKANFLPTRRALTKRRLDYEEFGDEMALFTEQSTTVPTAMAAVQALPSFNKINTRMADEFDLMFTSGQSARETAEKLSEAIETAVSA